MLRSIGMAVLMSLGLLAAAPAAFAQDLVPCARENEFCRVPYPTRVVYGVPGRQAALAVSGRGVMCSNTVFGDPAWGIPKGCAYVARRFDERPGYGFHREGTRIHDRRARDFGPDEAFDRAAWRTCAPENGFCRFAGVRRVRYGVRGRFVEGTYRGGVSCSNGVFGDPVPGQPKLCQVLD